MLSIGDAMVLTLAIVILVWIFKKQKTLPEAILANGRFRIVCYLLASASFLTTAMAFGYYLSFYIELSKCAPTGTKSQLFLAVLILSGISTLFLAAITIICIFLPKVTDAKYLAMDDQS